MTRKAPPEQIALFPEPREETRAAPALATMVERASALGIHDRLRAVHADLGAMEWPQTGEIAAAQAAHYGIPFHTVRRMGGKARRGGAVYKRGEEYGDLLDYARRRGAFPDSARRWCTSEFKRGPILKHFTAMALRWQREHETRRPCRILDCIGLRGEESAARAKRAVFTPRLSTRNKHVDTFLPIHALTEDDVWARIHASGAPVHPAYALGMSRLSCVFCILAGKTDLEIAARHNPELLAEYIEVERETGHDFKQGFSLASLE